MMMKEIFDQPISLSNAMSGRISADGINVEIGGFNLSKEEISSLDRLTLLLAAPLFMHRL